MTGREFVDMDYQVLSPLLNPSSVNFKCDWTRIFENGLPSFKPSFETELGECKMRLD